LLSSGAFNEAMIELKNAEAAAPGDPRVLLLIAKTGVQLGNLEASAQTLDQASKHGADRAEIARIRARLLMEKNDYHGLLALSLDEGAALEPVQRQVLRARALTGLDRCTEAIPLARAALRADPSQNSARIALAQCYAAHGDPERGLRELNAVEDPEASTILMARGRLQRALGKRDEAKASWIKAAQNPRGDLSIVQLVMLLSPLADLQIEQNDVKGLQGTYRAMLQLAPQAKITELLAARMKLIAGDVAAAVGDLRKLASEAPDLPSVHAILASAYIRQGNWEQARREASWIEANVGGKSAQNLGGRIGMLATLPANSQEFCVRSAGLHAGLGQLDAARDALEHALALDASAMQARFAQARLELQASNPGAALSITSSLLRTQPEALEVKALQADALMAMGRFSDASSVLDEIRARQPSALLAITSHRVRARGSLGDVNAPLEQWLITHPQDLEVRSVYAESLRFQGDERRAIAEYETLVAAAPRNVPALNNLAWLYCSSGDERALDMAKRAHALAPGSAMVLDTYGWLLVERGSLDEGSELLRQADASAGLTEPEIRVHYVTALARQGKSEQARGLLAELMAETPAFPSHSEASRLLTSLRELHAT